MTDAETAVLPLMASFVPVALSAWSLYTRAKYHRRVIRVTGVWRGLGDVTDLKPSYLGGRRCAFRIGYRCPVTGQQRVHHMQARSNSRSWRLHGDPYQLYIDPSQPDEPRSRAREIALTTAIGGIMLASLYYLRWTWVS